MSIKNEIDSCGEDSRKIAIEAEEFAVQNFEKAVREAIESAEPIWHWGDDQAGYLISVFTDIAHEILKVKSHSPLPPKKQYITPVLRKTVFERDAYRCKHCGTHINLTVDHIYPESKGGTLELSNLQTLCASCNSKKGVKL